MRLPIFGYFVFVIALVGVFINVASIVLLVRKNRPSPFHQLLKILAVYDTFVVICCSISYGIPDVFPGYLEYHHPLVVQWVFPVSHIVVMTSIYCTILISFERYVRICFFCQLRSTRLISADNFKFYVAALILGPLVFCVPKFFEVEANLHMVEHPQSFNCSKLRIMDYDDTTMALFQSMMDPEDIRVLNRLGNICGRTQLASKSSGISSASLLLAELKRRLLAGNRTNDPDSVLKAALSKEPLFSATTTEKGLKIASSLANYTIDTEIFTLRETELRKNPFYYKFYYVYLNLIFTSILPLSALLYLNIFTVKALRQIIVQDEIGRGDPPFILRKSVSHDNLDAIIGSSLYQNIKRSHSTNSIEGDQATTRRMSMRPEEETSTLEYVSKSQEPEVSLQGDVGHLILLTRERRKSLPNRDIIMQRRRQSVLRANTNHSIQIEVTHEPDETKQLIKPKKTRTADRTKSNPNLSVNKLCPHGRAKRLLSVSDPMPDLLELTQVILETTNEEEEEEKKTFDQCDRKGTRRSTVLTVLDFTHPKESKLAPSPEEDEEMADAPSQAKAHPVPDTCSRLIKAQGETNRQEPNKLPAFRTVSLETPREEAKGSALNVSQEYQSGPTVYLAADIAASNRLRRHSKSAAAQILANASRRGTVIAENGSLALTLTSQPCGSERAQEKRLTRISIFIVWLYIFCHAWKLVPTLYEAALSHNGTEHADWPFVIVVIEHISHLMITFNSAINFLIYLFL